MREAHYPEWRYEDCAELYQLFKDTLSADFTEPPGSNVPSGRYVHELH
jgi:hypothetical protein